MRFITAFFSTLLTPLMVVLPLQAETAAIISGSDAPVTETSAAAGPTGQTNSLQIRLADAAKSVVDASSSVKGYAILVTDATGLPVAGAAVAIRLPEDGATGFFADGAHSAVAYTNAAGVATFAQVNWSATPGSSLIRVTAVKGEQHTGALIEQTIVARSQAAPAGTPAGSAVASAKVPLTIKPLPSNTSVSPATPSAQIPGTPVSTASVQTGAATDKSQAPVQTATNTPEPVVSIVNSSGSKGSSRSSRKWILVAVVAAGAGVGAALALSGKGAVAASSAPSSGISIGTPTLSVGH